MRRFLSPGGVGSNHGIERGEQLGQAGNQCDLEQLASGDQALVESPDGGVVPAGSERGHVQHAAHVEASALDASLAIGAMPTSAAISRRFRHPSSGTSAISVALATGPIPLADCSSALSWAKCSIM